MKSLIFIFTLVLSVYCAPYEGFPFAKQLPTVARVNEAYYFQLSNETYLSEISAITYSISDAPSWLSFDASTRSFSGTPAESDVSNAVSFVLTGADSQSSISTTQYLVVSDSTGPVASTEFTVLSQLAEIGQTNGINALVLNPGEVFNVTFDSKTFTSDVEIVAYYGTSSDRTPLPNWLFFDSSNLRFSGVAPVVNSDIAPGFAYTFNFIATDYAGYTGSSVDFNIIVGAHDMTTTVKSIININGTSGDEINFNIPLESIYQDGEPILSSQISNTVMEGNPEWLSLDNFTIVGEIPSDYSNVDDETFFNVTIYDAFSNSVSLFFEIELISSLFAVTSFRSINATRGDFFRYYFLPTDFTDYSSTEILVTATGSGTWLEYHSSNLTISGLTPDDFEETTITVTATSGSVSDSLSFVIYGVDSIEQTSSSESSSASSTESSSSTSASSTSESVSSVTSTPTTTPVSDNSNKSTDSDNKKKLAIGLGVAIPLFVIIVVALLLVFCCMRRRKNDKSNDKEFGPENTPKISKPILGNPANGQHNMISPNAFDASSTDGSFDNEKLETVEGEPKRLGALNVLKLDEKDYYSDNGSVSTANANSSFGIHDDSKSSIYQDALQAHSTDQLMKDYNDNQYSSSGYPKKSWRQTIDSKINRESLNSLASVSTNELLSMRIAEDDDIQKDPRKSNLNFRDSAFLGSSTSAILTRDDSGNIQRLDSDGNIVESLKDTRQRASRATNLDILTEENGFSPIIPHNTHENSFTSTSSGGAEFYPVGNSNGETKWLQQDKNKESTSANNGITNLENGSNAKLKNFTYKVRATDTSNDVTQSSYETAEIESL